jgi:hypothetical protein
MFITSHILFSVLISQKMDSPLEAFLFSLASHYILDLIPHGDESVGHWIKKKLTISRFIFTSTIDVAILCVIITLLFINKELPSPPVFMASVIGGVLPDVMCILNDLFAEWQKNISQKIIKYARYFPVTIAFRYNKKLHNFIHHLIPVRLSVKKGLVVQVILIFTFILLA